MKYEYHAVVIGAGSAGLVVASGASGLGAKIALIEKNKMGGDCLNYGCVPSKSLIKSAHVAKTIKDGSNFGITSSETKVNLNKIMTRVNDVIESIAPHDSKERYEGLGVDVFDGTAIIIDKHHVKVNDKLLSCKNIVIATGSKPNIPPIKGLKEAKFYTNETIFKLNKLPKHLVVLGAGPIGSELGQAFKYLGSEVTIVDRATTLFKKDDFEASQVMLKQFKNDGINLKLGASILEIKQNETNQEVIIEINGIKESLIADAILVSLGRHSDTKDLGLEKLEIKMDKNNRIISNEKLQTSISNIYLCGDVVGPYAFTHMASYQASIVIQNMIFPIKKKVNYSNVPWVTYTSPEVAHVGYTEQDLIAKNIKYHKYSENLASNDRARAEGLKNGFLKILVNHKGIVIGATMVGDKAGEQISLANMAISKKMNIKDFASLTIAYPTESEIYKSLAFKAIKEGFTPFKKKIVKKLFFS